MKQLLVLLLLAVASISPVRANTTTDTIVSTAKACLYDSGIRRIAIDVVRVDGSSAIVTYEIPDAGSATLYLAFDGTAWHCLGGTGGVPGKGTYRRISADYAKYHVSRSSAALHDLAIGKRGKTLLKVASPKTVTLTRPTPQ